MVDAICPVCRKACLDSFREHAVHCKELTGFKYRHDMVRDVHFGLSSRDFTMGLAAFVLAPEAMKLLNRVQRAMNNLYQEKSVEVEESYFDSRGKAWYYTYAYIQDGVNGYLLNRCIISCKKPGSESLIVAAVESGRRDTNKHTKGTGKPRCIQKHDIVQKKLAIETGLDFCDQIILLENYYQRIL
ncbi:hypothetical protein Tco_0228176 [Tanacetum coccineum]